MLYYSDPVTEIYQGDIREVVKDLPLASCDMVMTSPPFYGLRAYKIPDTIWDGDGNCEHEWSQRAKLIKHHADETNPGLAGYFKNDGAMDDKGSSFCSLCGAWRGCLGTEPSPDLYISHLCDIFDLLKPVLKKTATIWVDIADSYSGGGAPHGDHRCKGASLQANQDKYQKRPDTVGALPKSLIGIPERFVLEMQRRGYVRRNTIIWHKRNCLAGVTPVYIRSMGRPLRTTVREMARLPIKTLEIAGNDGWRKVTEIERNESTTLLTIHLRNGTAIKCTYDHLFPVDGSLLKADQIGKGMKLARTILPSEVGTAFGTEEIGWFVGLYLAEGSRTGKSLQFSLNKDEVAYSERLRQIALSCNELWRQHFYDSKLVSILSGPILSGIIDHYVDGYGCKKKHLSQNAFCEGNAFLDGVLSGYLQGDGHYEQGNDRWKIGFAFNRELEYDLRVICNRLGYHMRAWRRKAKYQNGETSVIRGEIRKRTSGHFNQKDDYEILRIERTKGVTYRIEVDGDHLFALCDGTLTHNCMPESVTDRFTEDFDYLYLFSLQGKYFFERQFEPYSEAGLERSKYVYNGNPDGLDRIQQGSPIGFKTPNPLGRNMRTVWDIPTATGMKGHYAQYPEKLCETPILAGCPLYICSKCGKPRKKVYKETRQFQKPIRDDGPISETFRHFEGLRWDTTTLDLGYSDCLCGVFFEPGVVLDPFVGTGTTLSVAKRLGRKSIGVELSEKYCKLAQRRIEATQSPLGVI